MSDLLRVAIQAPARSTALGAGSFLGVRLGRWSVEPAVAASIPQRSPRSLVPEPLHLGWSTLIPAAGWLLGAPSRPGQAVRRKAVIRVPGGTPGFGGTPGRGAV